MLVTDKTLADEAREAGNEQIVFGNLTPLLVKKKVFLDDPIHEGGEKTNRGILRLLSRDRTLHPIYFVTEDVAQFLENTEEYRGQGLKKLAYELGFQSPSELTRKIRSNPSSEEFPLFEESRDSVIQPYLAHPEGDLAIELVKYPRTPERFGLFMFLGDERVDYDRLREALT